MTTVYMCLVACNLIAVYSFFNVPLNKFAFKITKFISNKTFLFYFTNEPTIRLKNLSRKTAQYFLDTLHIREAAITP